MEKIGIIIASVREGRRGEAFATWLHGLAAARAGVDAQIVDLRSWPLPSYARKLLPVAAEAAYEPESLEGRWASLVRSLDAFVIVTPEYNRGYPGQLKTAIDTLYPAWNYKPVAFATYGGFAGGARAAEQLTTVAVEVRMVPVRDQLNLKLIGLAVDDKGAPSEEIHTRRANGLLDELVWFSRVMREARATRTKT